MHTANYLHPDIFAISDELRNGIELELTRILESSQFRSSRRSCEFLRFIVESALNGRFDLLKERSVGVAVFGREANYDTGSDAAVRVRASDVRRRLASYYDAIGNRSSVRIGVRAGTYIPHFLEDEQGCASITYLPGSNHTLVIRAESAEALHDAARSLSRRTLMHWTKSATPVGYRRGH